MSEDFESFLERISHFEAEKIVFSNPASVTVSKYKKVVFLPKLIKGNECYQIEKYTDTQVFHENIGKDELFNNMRFYYDAGFKQINYFQSDMQTEVKISKKGACHVTENRIGTDKIKIRSKSNNREKNYILEPGSDIPVFTYLGIFTKDGRVSNDKYDKFKQINRFAEMVDDVLRDYPKEQINIIDFGCGKSYLTFVLYYYLKEIKGIDCNIIGLDLKADVIKKCNALAEQFGYENLRFEIGDINGYKAPFEVDMVVTLHACDTATDYALYNAITWNAGIIMSVPCCQHEVNKCMQSDSLSALTKYGIVKERIAALITDAIRGCMLEYCGYKTDLMEFVDIEHSPKNILIRAVKTNVSKQKREKSYAEAKALADEFTINQQLMELLKNE